MSAFRRRAGSTGRMRCTPIPTTRPPTSCCAPTPTTASRGTASRSRAVAATRCASPPIRALEPFVVGRTLDGDRRRHERLLAQPRLGQPAALARAGEGRRSTSPRPRSSTPSGICGRSVEGKPLWKLLVDLTPEEIVGCVDFRYITDALAPEEALDLLRDARRGSDGPRGGDRRVRLPGLHDVGRLARLRRREGRVARARGASRPASRT